MAEPHERITVLVVDDSRPTLSLMSDALEEAGIRVLVSLDATSALDLLEHAIPDVIVLDAVMPGIDGFEACRRIKRNPDWAHIPVLFMTGLRDSEHVIQGLNAGGVDYVPKPIVTSELIARIRVHVGNAKRAQSAKLALDAAGRAIIAADRAARVLWSTPQAASLMKLLTGECQESGYDLPPAVLAWLERARNGGPDEGIVVESEQGAVRFDYVGESGEDEFLLRLGNGAPRDEAALLQGHLPVTRREAEVLRWIAHGKSNRDIADILGLSPRTVNKHLEQIFVKLGVENRTAAASIAVRLLAQ
jgi:DNA-binding NarL/FixJ family response regulator